MEFKRIAVKGFASVAMACAAGAIASAPAHALTLTQYNFSSSNEPSTVAPNTTSSNVFGLGPNSQFNVGGGVVNYITTNGLSGNASTSEASAIATSSFVNFLIAPTGGNTLNLNFVSIQARNSYFPGGRLFLRSSVDNFAANIGATQTINEVGSGFGTYTFNLSAPAFQNRTGNVVFALYVFNPDPSVGANSYDFDNLTIDGTVSATPVPFPFAPLPGIALVWGAGKIRRKLQEKQQSVKAMVNA